MNTIKKFADQIGKHAEKYLDWAVSLPKILGLSAIVIPLFVITYLIFQGLALKYRQDCLHSEYPRRYHNFICEEHQDGQWIEIGTTLPPIYYYNEKGTIVNEGK